MGEPKQPDPPSEPEDLSDEIAADEAERDSYDPPTVTQALSLVMGDVQSISKRSRNEAQQFNFRGIDAVMNAVGPALREHGVVVVPIKTKYEAEHYKTSNNKHMKGVTLTVTFRFYGPAGDHIDATATGEASDAGDKAMPKAHSVAFRTMLLQALCIPTDEPDPDLEAHDRAAMPFEGSSGSERRPRERQQAPTYNAAQSWQELTERMSALVGEDEAKVWMAQGIEIATGVHDRADLTAEQRAEAFSMLSHVLFELDHEQGDLQMHPEPRQTISAAFAKHLDGRILNGPQWALTGEEAERGYPSKEGAAQNQADEQAEAEETATEEPREPTAEEIAEAQASLDEAAAAAAELDRDQTRDASGK